jgi:hypothetical protein
MPQERVQTAQRSAPNGTRPVLEGPVARAVLLQALLLGLAGDGLLYGLHAGVGFPLFVGALSLGAVSLVWRAGRTLPREAAAWLSTAVLFAAARAWRDSDILQALDLFATLGALWMAALALNDARAGLLAPRLRDTVLAALAVARTILAGVLPIALQELFAPTSGTGLGRRARPVLRAGLIATALVLLFGSLLRDADPIFASLIALPEMARAEVVSHLLLFGIVAWFVGGWARGALTPIVPRRRAPDALPFSLGMLDVTTALAALNVLFALFVASQLGWFFGGERFLHERTGLTAAEYARSGFFQMVLVVLLVVPVLVGTRAALQPGNGLARRHSMLSLPIIALLAAMIVSAMLRMRLYVHYFGLTTDRFYPMAFMGWLALVLVWLALTVLRGRGRPFVAGVVISGASMLAALHVWSADVIVAKVNLARAQDVSRDASSVLDLAHLSSLSGEAARLAVLATLAERQAPRTPLERAAADRQGCRAAKRLLVRWGPSSEIVRRAEQPGAWRSWNAGESRAIRVVGENAAALRVRMRVACASVAPRPGIAPAAASAGALH